MAKITLTKLTCERKQDVTGKDEPEIWLDGKKKWDGVMKKGETVVLIPLFEDFEDSIKVELKERNPNSSKLLGTKTVTAGRPDPQPVDFKTSGAHYQLVYSLT